MCGECNWPLDKDAEPQLNKKCDCGNSKWVKAANNSVADNAPLTYRCTKCDALHTLIN